MTQANFYLDYNVTGPERKRLVDAIAAFTGEDASYLGAPSFAYEVGIFHIDRAGCVSFDNRSDSGLFEGLIEQLANQGFVSLVSNLGCEEDHEPEPTTPNDPEAIPDDGGHYGLTVTVPASTFDAVTLGNLQSLVNSKHGLITKALGIDRLPVVATEETVSFPWFERDLTPEEAGAYGRFIGALCEMARNQTRVTARNKVYDNDRYAFRCFLLRLGYIGDDYKADRKILLKRLSGSSAFKSGSKKTAEEGAPESEEATASGDAAV